MPRVNTAPGEILIANIKNAEVERLAVQKDENHNDRLSVDEAVAVFEAHKGRPPRPSKSSTPSSKCNTTCSRRT